MTKEKRYFINFSDEFGMWLFGTCLVLGLLVFFNECSGRFEREKAIQSQYRHAQEMRMLEDGVYLQEEHYVTIPVQDTDND